MREFTFNNSEATIVLSITELISILKAVLMDHLNIDLDELEVTVLAKYSDNRLYMTLDTELLREKSMYEYIQLVQDIKRIFSPYIFVVNTAIDTNILINKLFAGYDYYRINEDMSIEIYY